MDTPAKEIKSVDLHFECCRRYYYYGLHSYKCKQINHEEIKRQEDVEIKKGDDQLRGTRKAD